MYAELNTDDLAKLRRWVTEKIGTHHRTEITVVRRRELYLATVVGDATAWLPSAADFGSAES
jgi:hypothetical protein